MASATTDTTRSQLLVLSVAEPEVQIASKKKKTLRKQTINTHAADPQAEKEEFQEDEETPLHFFGLHIQIFLHGDTLRHQ